MKRALRFIVVLGSCAAMVPSVVRAGGDITLAWDASPDPSVSGYHLYYGTTSRAYSNMLDAHAATTGTVSNLATGATYYFAATTYSAAGLESAYSAEASYTLVAPANQPPTLDPINNITINENAGQQTVNLSGISAGASNEIQTLTVSAFSSTPGVIPNPTVSYTSPNATGSLAFTPATNSFGSASVTVMVDDGSAMSNTIIRSFTVTVVPPVVTNVTILPNSQFRFVINPPFTNNDHLAFSLDPSAPDGATITTRKGVSALIWVPDTTQASTTNLITIRITDNTNPALSTTETLQVIVLDYMNIALDSTAVQAGQNVSLPVYLSSSDGVTNVSFSLAWSTNRFLNPVLSNAMPTIGASSLVAQSTNLRITVGVAAGKVLQGTNTILRLSFQTASNQSSAFVPLPISSISAIKSNAMAYTNCTARPGRVVVVKDVPLLESFASNSVRSMAFYGRVGTNYQVQYSTSPGSKATWQPLTSYTQTNVAQTVSVSSSSPFVLYRLLQQ